MNARAKADPIVTRLQRARLRRYVCWLCEIRLDRNWCVAIGAPRCSEEVMAKRRADCLSKYRPRQLSGGDTLAK
jgi:hypothetical protein